jgi:hypothetical protein
MFGDAGQDVGEPGLRIDIVHLGGDDQAVHNGGALAASNGRQDVALVLAIAKRSFNMDTAHQAGIAGMGMYALKLYYDTEELREGVKAQRIGRVHDAFRLLFCGIFGSLFSRPGSLPIRPVSGADFGLPDSAAQNSVPRGRVSVAVIWRRS